VPDVLDDLLAPGLALVICGSAAGNLSAALRQYYAHPQNRFWRTLHETNLTPRLLAPSEYRELLAFGIGLTDVVKDQSGSDSQLDYARAGPAALREKLVRFSPAICAFNSKRAARGFLGRAVEYGWQSERVGATRLYVAPSTSPAASGSWDVALWHALARCVRKHSP
jgi:TDG/mug DNA glycosylase family protein